MKIFKHTLAIIVIALLNQIGYAQYHVSKSESATSNRGIFYSLPQTYLIIDVEVQETAFFKGPYSDFANRYLGLDDVIFNDYSEFQISAINISTGHQPDPSQSYFVDIPVKTSSKDNRSLLLSTDRNGNLSFAGNYPSPPDKQKIINGEATHLIKGENFDPQGLFNYVLRPGMMEVIDTIVRVVTIDTNFIEDIHYEKRFVEMTIEQKAQIARDQINKLRNDRYKLLTGYQEIAYDKGAIQYMHEQLKLQENEYLAMFIGKKLKRTHNYRFYYTPQNTEKEANIPIFKFSEQDGLSRKGRGEQVFIRFKSNEVSNNAKSQSQNLESKNPEKHGFYYRIPEYADVHLVLKGKILSTNKFMIPQFGVVSYIPFGENVEIELNTESGSIKKLFIK